MLRLLQLYRLFQESLHFLAVLQIQKVLGIPWFQHHRKALKHQEDRTGLFVPLILVDQCLPLDLAFQASQAFQNRP